MIKMLSGNENYIFSRFQLYARAYVGIWTLLPWGITRGYKGLHVVTRAYRGLQINFFLSRTFPKTFFWFILHNNKSGINLKILTKTIDFFFSNKANFAFFINRCSKSLETLLFYPEHQ